MHILIIDDEITDRSRISCYTDVTNYYLCRELRKKGVELSFVSGGSEAEPAPLREVREWPLEGVDHVLALGLRYFTRTQAASVLAKRFRGAITQMHDCGIFVRDVDCTFTTKDDSHLYTGTYRHLIDCNYYVGWAADPELIKPAQTEGELCILVDHENYEYAMEPVDHSQAIIESAARFVGSGIWKSKYKSVVVRQLVNGGARYVDLNNPSSYRFDRKHIPFEEICQEYGRASLYMVTHEESVGLTCLETAMAGAFVVVPRDFVSFDRLRTIRSVEYEGDVPWDRLLDNIDVKASREVAMQNSWSAVADRILAYFAGFGGR